MHKDKGDSFENKKAYEGLTFNFWQVYKINKFDFANKNLYM